MNRNMLVFVALALTPFVAQSQSLTRVQVMANAATYRDESWTMGSKNTRSTCKPPLYLQTNSKFPVGSTVKGVAYCWGGGDTLATFRDGLSHGEPAGNICTTLPSYTGGRGVDCSGLVTRAWGRTESHLGTGELASNKYSGSVPGGISSARSGDILVWSGHHTVLINSWDPSGKVSETEASDTDWKVTSRVRDWSYFQTNYVLRRNMNLQDAGFGKVDQGLTVSNAPRVNKTFSVSFRIRETDSAPIRYDEITVAILTTSGALKFDLQHVQNVQLSAGGTYSATVTGTANLAAGSYLAVARGRIGSAWSDLLTTGSGKNGVQFTVAK